MKTGYYVIKLFITNEYRKIIHCKQEYKFYASIQCYLNSNAGVYNYPLFGELWILEIR